MINDLLFRFRSIEAVQGSSNGQLKQQLAHAYVLVVAAAGQARMMCDYERYEMRRGTVCLVKPGQTFGVESFGEDAELYAIRFDVYRPDERGNEAIGAVKDADVLPAANGEMAIAPPDKLVEICEQLYRTNGSGEQLAPFRCQIAFQNLLVFIHMNSRTKQGSTDSALDYVKKYVEEHYTESLTVQQLAQMAELSQNYFVDLFKKRFGRSVMDYVAELRLMEAKRLLSLREWRLRDIANRVGYGDEFYFSRKFKKYVGVSPKTYMQSRTSKLVAYESSLLGYLVPLQLLPYAAPLHPKWTEFYYRHYRDDIPVHTNASVHHQVREANLELLKPIAADLVITSDQIGEEEKHILATIAPEICYVPAVLGWREQLRFLGERLGEKWQAEKWLELYDQQANLCRERIGGWAAGRRAIVVRMAEERLILYCNRGMTHVLYEELGMRAAYRAESDVYSEPVTLEQLARIPVELIFLLVRQDSETLNAWSKLQHNPLWRQIEAVSRNRLYRITSDPWREYSAHAQLRMLEQAARLLSENHP